MLEESARLSRGPIKELKDLKADQYHALVVPGGSGVAKNFCDYLLKGPVYTVDPLIEGCLKEFLGLKKPIALCCIAPILAAKLFGKKQGGPGVELTMGHTTGASWPYAKTAGKINSGI